MTDILLNIDSPPSDAPFRAHYHADFIELRSLINNDMGVEVNAVIDLYESEPSKAKLDNLLNLNCECLGIIKYRENEYGQDHYPFHLSSANNLQLKEDLNNAQKLYIFLLLCSCSSNLSSSHASDVRRDFERISKEVLSKYLPSNSICHIMGKSGIEEQRYKGHITDKLTLLAKDLQTSAIFESHFFSAQNSGDGGLDVVAWLPFSGDSSLKFTQFYVAQCATGRDWTKKQDEPDKLKKYIKTPDSFNKCLFIPYDGRNSDGRFNQQADILSDIVFDRLRMLHISDELDFINDIPSITIVNDLINFENDLI